MGMPLRVAWMTDPHLVFLTPSPNFPEDDLTPFLRELAEQPFDVLVISGDISEAHMLESHLALLESHLQRPVYFVLGNHDFYWSSVERVSTAIKSYTEKSRCLRCLEFASVVELTPNTGMIGHGCWADGRFGSLYSSSKILNDWRLIEELNRCTDGPELPPDAMDSRQARMKFLERRLGSHEIDMEKLGQELRRLGDVGAQHIARLLPDAFAKYPRLILVTHVPPFLPEQPPQRWTWEEWAPHAGCKAVADVILEVMDAHPKQQLTILSGHVHREYRKAIRPNIDQRIGKAERGEPRINDTILVQ